MPGIPIIFPNHYEISRVASYLHAALLNLFRNEHEANLPIQSLFRYNAFNGNKERLGLSYLSQRNRLLDA